jgi:glycolate oxidase iron-sulfur subunit
VQTQLADFIRDTAEGREADAILRKCVHCGFCNATCPTYQLLGDELDGPRGRIYLVKQVLEGAAPTAKTRLHLDRCLSCRACETTCPSGVEYGRLADIGRGIVEVRVARGFWDGIRRRALGTFLPRTGIFSIALLLGWLTKPFLPRSLQQTIPERPKAAGTWPAPRHQRRMLALAGCVQPALAPAINAAAARVLDRNGISLLEVPGAGCCGALRFHLNEQEAGRDDMRALIDAWWPSIERGEIEAIVMTASGCGSFVKEFVHHLQADADYRRKAERISAMTKDLSEVVPENALEKKTKSGRVAFQSPCSLQHGQQLRGGVEALLRNAGYELAPVAEGHLCCGSAGTYSILQPELSGQLRERKLAALAAGGPGVIATANIGCLAHLQAGTRAPPSATRVRIVHWIELLDESSGSAENSAA